MSPSPETSVIRWEGKPLRYAIRRSARRRKTVSLTVDRDGGVLVQAPANAATGWLDEVVRRKAPWIVRQLSRPRLLEPLPGPREWVSGASVLYLGRHYRLKVDARGGGEVALEGGWLRVPAAAGPQQPGAVRAAVIDWLLHRAAECLPERVAAWWPKVGAAPTRIVIANQRRLWGSCSHRGVIRLNWRIIQARLPLIDYVVVHELVHLLHRGHGRDYWQAVARVMPDYDRRRKELRQCGEMLDW